jgi:hypothetical protein
MESIEKRERVLRKERVMRSCKEKGEIMRIERRNLEEMSMKHGGEMKEERRKKYRLHLWWF